MFQAVKKLWTDALRSGNYQQCYYKWNNGPDCGCTVGVLGFLFFKAEGIPFNRRVQAAMLNMLSGSPHRYYESPYFIDLGTGLAERFKAWTGIQSWAEIKQFSDLNDFYSADFSNIATLIEEHIPDERTPSGNESIKADEMAEMLGLKRGVAGQMMNYGIDFEFPSIPTVAGLPLSTTDLTYTPSRRPQFRSWRTRLYDRMAEVQELVYRDRAGLTVSSEALDLLMEPQLT